MNWQYSNSLWLFFTNNVKLDVVLIQETSGYFRKHYFFDGQNLFIMSLGMYFKFWISKISCTILFFFNKCKPLFLRTWTWLLEIWTDTVKTVWKHYCSIRILYFSSNSSLLNSFQYEINMHAWNLYRQQYVKECIKASKKLWLRFVRKESVVNC